jgi:hypothetical protein
MNLKDDAISATLSSRNHNLQLYCTAIRHDPRLGPIALKPSARNATHVTFANCFDEISIMEFLVDLRRDDGIIPSRDFSLYPILDASIALLIVLLHILAPNFVMKLLTSLITEPRIATRSQFFVDSLEDFFGSENDFCSSDTESEISDESKHEKPQSARSTKAKHTQLVVEQLSLDTSCAVLSQEQFQFFQGSELPSPIEGETVEEYEQRTNTGYYL